VPICDSWAFCNGDLPVFRREKLRQGTGHDEKAEKINFRGPGKGTCEAITGFGVVFLMPSLIVHLAWMLMTVLRFASVATVFAGVGLFGIYFIGGNARASDGAFPTSSWLGPGPRKGMWIAGFGVLMLLSAFAIRSLMPDGT
jgi:hypothetical protein